MSGWYDQLECPDLHICICIVLTFSSFLFLFFCLLTAKSFFLKIVFINHRRAGRDCCRLRCCRHPSFFVHFSSCYSCCTRLLLTKVLSSHFDLVTWIHFAYHLLENVSSMRSNFLTLEEMNVVASVAIVNALSLLVTVPCLAFCPVLLIIHTSFRRMKPRNSTSSINEVIWAIHSMHPQLFIVSVTWFQMK